MGQRLTRIERRRARNNNGSLNPDILVAPAPPVPQKLVPVTEKKIMGFWHICMINQYFDIISEQLTLLIKSGLYEKADSIFSGCAGSEADFFKVKELFSSYSKINLLHLPDIKEFEFPTLNHLKISADSNDDFFAFYFHTKGVSHPGNEGGKHWRDYMNYYTLTNWKKNVDKLMEGYSTCGVKLIPAGDFPLHYSGNFWWAHSGYVKTLKPINELNRSDRFSAEMWIGSNAPVPASLCQTFVDYDTKGAFVPVRNRIIVHTLAYNLATEVREATRLLYEQNDPKDFEHLIVDLGFPLTAGDKIPEDINKAKLFNAQANLNTALMYDSQFCSLKNEGVSQNWNVAKKQMAVKDTDVLICADPDERPKQAGWLKAIQDVICYGSRVAWCSLMMKEHLPHLASSRKINIHGHNVYIVNGALNWAQGGFSGKFLNEIGGVPVPSLAPIYGWIESAAMEKIRDRGYIVVVLADYFVEHTECSPLYRAWKTDVTSNVKQGQVDFEQWLKNKHV